MDRQPIAALNRIVELSLAEQSISCPFCGEGISILLDFSAGPQSYIEDCPVCCQPIQVTFETDGSQALSLQVDCAS